MAADDLTRIQVKPRSSLALRSQQNGELIELRGEMIIGREIDCDVQLSFRQVSRYHAKIYVASNGLFIEDLNSSNGTFINGKAIKERSLLKLGDQLSFDNLHFRVTTARSSVSDQTQLSSSQELPPHTVNEINRVEAGRLKPASSTANEKLREFSVFRSLEDNPAVVPKQADVPQITDVDAFLKFAGSGLKPKSSLEQVPENPYRGILNKQNQHSPRLAKDLSAVPLESPPEKVLLKELSLDCETPVAEAHNKEQPALRPLQTQEQKNQTAEPKARLNPVTGFAKPSAAEARPGARPSNPQTDDSTLHIGLRELDRFVLANQFHHQDLAVGSGPRLIAMTAPIRGKVFQLESEEDVQCWSIGRDDSADICLRDKAVSREHIWITKYESLYQLRVNDDACDVLINGEACSEAELRSGDRIQVGSMELLFRTDLPASENDSRTGASIFSHLFYGIRKLFRS